MIKKLLIICLIITCLASNAFACTTIMVGRGASTDGSHFIGRTVDISTLLISKLQHIPAYNMKKSVIYHDNTVNLELKLPANGYECFAIPTNQTIYEGNTTPSALQDFWWESVINEKRVGISATETLNVNNKVIALDPFVNSGLREGNIPRLVIPYVSSAREGVIRLAKLVEKYGMVSPEAVIFIDDKEIWYMEIYTGHHYAAQKMPKDCVACIANDAMLGFYDARDRENWIASNDIVEFAKKTGTYKELDGKFHLALSYGIKRRDDTQLRLWAGRRYFAPSTAGEYDVYKHYELFFKPDKKISITDAFELSRDRHEGTPQATDKQGNNTRPIGVDRTTQAHFIQFRKSNCAPVLWASLAAPEFSVYFPILGLPNKIDKNFTYYSLNYDSNAFVWKLLEIASFASHDRRLYSHMVRDKFAALERKFVNTLDSLEDRYKSQGANIVLADVTRQTEGVANEVKASILKAVAKQRIEDTKFLGMGKVDEITARIFKTMTENKLSDSKFTTKEQPVEVKVDTTKENANKNFDDSQHLAKKQVNDIQTETSKKIKTSNSDVEKPVLQTHIDDVRDEIHQELLKNNTQMNQSKKKNYNKTDRSQIIASSLRKPQIDKSKNEAPKDDENNRFSELDSSREQTDEQKAEGSKEITRSQIAANFLTRTSRHNSRTTDLEKIKSKQIAASSLGKLQPNESKTETLEKQQNGNIDNREPLIKLQDNEKKTKISKKNKSKDEKSLKSFAKKQTDNVKTKISDIENKKLDDSNTIAVDKDTKLREKILKDMMKKKVDDPQCRTTEQIDKLKTKIYNGMIESKIEGYKLRDNKH